MLQPVYYFGIMNIANNGIKLINTPPSVNIPLIFLSAIVASAQIIPNIAKAAGIIKLGYLGKFKKIPAPDNTPHIKAKYKNLRICHTSFSLTSITHR